MAIVSAVVGVFGVVSQQAQARKAARAQREAGAISTASGDIRDRAARRRAAREERIRRARLLSTSAASGGANSSGELGSISALGANFDSSVAQQSSESLSAQGLTAANQKLADAQSKMQSIEAWTALIQGGIKTYQEAKK